MEGLSSKSKLGSILIGISCLFVFIGTVLYYFGIVKVVSLSIILVGVLGLILIGIFGTIAMIGYIERLTVKKEEQKEAGTDEKKDDVPLRVTLTELMFYTFSLIVVVIMCCLILWGIYSNNFMIASLFQIIAIVVFDFIILNSASDREIRSIRLIYIYTIINVFYTLVVYFLSRENASNIFGLTVNNKYTTCVLIIDFVLIYTIYPFFINKIKELQKEEEKPNMEITKE